MTTAESQNEAAAKASVLSQEAVHFWKGRVAFYALLKAIEVGPGDGVLMPGYTCVVVPYAVRFAGATPCYADIDPATYNAALEHYEAAAAGKPVKAVVVQHTYGIPADLDPILDWARRRGIYVIEDCCHAMGSLYRTSGEGDGFSWKPTGQFGDAAFFSSQWSKPLTTGLGGWATARDPDVQARLARLAAAECLPPGRLESVLLRVQVALHARFFRPSVFWMAQGALRTLARLGLLVGSSTRDELAVEMPPGYTKRMSAWQRRRLVRLAAGADRVSAHRRQLKQQYDEALTQAGLPTFAPPEYADPVLLRYPFRVGNKRVLLQSARRRRIELGDWFSHPLHPAGSNLEGLAWQPGACPAGERAAAEVVNLPMHDRIGPRHVRCIVDFLKRHARPPDTG